MLRLLLTLIAALLAWLPGAAPASETRPAVALREPVASIVRVEARALEGATSAASLGARRSGSGVIIGERLVLTIGYLLLEVDMKTVVGDADSSHEQAQDTLLFI